MNGLNKFLGRFVIRPDDHNSTDGHLGIACLADNTGLPAGQVYNLVQCQMTSEIKLVQVGPSAIKMVMPDYEQIGYNPGCCWANDINQVMKVAKNMLFMTESECIEYIKSQWDKV